MPSFSFTLLEESLSGATALTASQLAGADAMRDFLLDTDGDLAVGTDLEAAKGVPAIAQALLIRLRFILGEWYADLEKGTPYFESILRKNPNLDLVRTILRDRILKTVGVSEILTLELDFNRRDRKLSVNDLTIRADTGQLIKLEITE